MQVDLIGFIFCIFGWGGMRFVNGVPLSAGKTSEGETGTSKHCIGTKNTLEDHCSICYDTHCPITDKEILAAFMNASLHIPLFGNVHRNPRSQSFAHYEDEYPSVLEEAKNCLSALPPLDNLDSNCTHVAKIGHDGCVQCYSNVCLQCNSTGNEHKIENSTGAVRELTHNKGLNPSHSNTASPNPHPSCPPIPSPPTRTTVGCMSTPERDWNGCIVSYNVVCPSTTISPVTKWKTGHSTSSPLSSTKCPKIKPPMEKPIPGCIQTENVDKNGCVVSYDMICSTPMVHLPPQPKPIAKNQNTAWRSMLGDEYRGPAVKDPKKFRPRASSPIPTSGRFVGCKRQSDCFPYREPKEWCMPPGANNGTFAWTDKSCYCAHDTERKTCLIERVNLRTKAVEWTFCSPKKDFTCA